jgi:hypothetical protein
MVKKMYQDPQGGLNEAGRQFYKRTTGANLKIPLKSGVNPRRVSFAARFAGMKGGMKDEKGKPSRLALALRKWGFRSRESARAFANKHKKK